MDVDIKEVSVLEREVTVTVPNDKIDDKFNAKLKELAKKVKIPGFRPGKVPANVVKQRFGEAVHGEIIGDVMRDTFLEVLKEKEISPAGMPNMEVTQSKLGEPLVYVAKFEIFPEVKLSPVADLKLERIQATLSDDDVNKMLEKLRKQNAEWSDVDRAAKDGDKVVIDFEGKVDGESFEGNSAKEFELELGSKSMIPGFEEGIASMKKDDQRDVNLTFPKDYRAENLAGKDAVFTIKLYKIQESKLPDLDDKFAEKLNIEGGLEALKKQVQENMQRELDQAIKNQNRDHVFENLMNANKLDLPKALVADELNRVIEQTKQMFRMQTGQDTLPEGQDEEFQQLAERRVMIGLLVQKFVEDNEIKADEDMVKKMVDDIAATYHTPEHVVNYYYRNKEQLAQVEAAATEQKVVEKIFEQANVTDKTLAYDEVMNPKPKEGK